MNDGRGVSLGRIVANSLVPKGTADGRMQVCEGPRCKVKAKWTSGKPGGGEQNCLQLPVPCPLGGLF